MNPPEPEPEPAPAAPAPTIEESAQKLIEKSEQFERENLRREKFSLEYIKTVRDPAEKRFKKTLLKLFVAQRNELQDIVDEWEKGEPHEKGVVQKITPEQAKKLAKLKLSPEKETVKMAKALLPDYKKAIQEEKVKVEQELGKPIAWGETSPAAKAALKERVKAIKGINNTTNARVASKIKSVITEAIEKNLSVPEVAKLLKEKIREVYNGDFRAKTIARTEMGIIQSEARFNLMTEAGVEFIEWVSARDEKVRDSEFSHVELDGQVVKLGEPFNNGEDIERPGDPSASAGNVINCRCIFVMSQGEKK
jgi:SPP1 gp7 family putative phage head morphogenesis protein